MNTSAPFAEVSLFTYSKASFIADTLRSALKQKTDDNLRKRLRRDCSTLATVSVALEVLGQSDLDWEIVDPEMNRFATGMSSLRGRFLLTGQAILTLSAEVNYGPTAASSRKNSSGSRSTQTWSTHTTCEASSEATTTTTRSDTRSNCTINDCPSGGAKKHFETETVDAGRVMAQRRIHIRQMEAAGAPGGQVVESEGTLLLETNNRLMGSHSSTVSRGAL